MMITVAYIVLGLIAGYISGLVGIGGGVIIIPALILLFGFSQQSAQGTTLALLIPPIGFLAAYTYFKNGYVDIRAALLICLGFFIGAFPGAQTATHVDTVVLQKIFGVGLFLISLKMIFFP